MIFMDIFNLKIRNYFKAIIYAFWNRLHLLYYKLKLLFHILNIIYIFTSFTVRPIILSPNNFFSFINLALK